MVYPPTLLTTDGTGVGAGVGVGVGSGRWVIVFYFEVQSLTRVNLPGWPLIVAVVVVVVVDVIGLVVITF